MAIWNYLNAYVSSIPTSQRQRLLNLLYSQVQSGQLKTIADYQNQFTADMAALNSDPTAPTFDLRVQNYQDVTNSANFNAMEGTAVGNLQTLYTEALLLEDAVSNHTSLVSANLGSIESTVDNLNKQVDQLELLAANNDGYVTSVYDSFSGANNSVNPSVDNNGYFIDTTLGYVINQASIEGGALKLPILNSTQFNITTVSLENQIPSGITSYDMAATIANSGNPVITNQYALANLITPVITNASTVTPIPWVETVDIPTLIDMNGNPVTAATTDLAIDIGGVQQVNRISINPFTRYPYSITDISYTQNINASGNPTSLSNYIDFPITIESNPTLIDLPASIYADSLTLHIVQNNYNSLRYTTTGMNNTISTLYNIATGQQLEPPASLMDPDTYYYAMTSNMKTLLGIDTTLQSDANQINVYEFLYGMNSIGVYRLNYGSNGIYVSIPYKVLKTGAVGLSVDEVIPPLTAIQYRVFADYKDILGGTETAVGGLAANILPGGVNTISDQLNGYPEILDGSDDGYGNWIGYTRFKVNTSLLSNVTVNQNGTTPVIGVVATDEAYGTTKIVFPSVNVVNRNTSFFTVNYTPISNSQVIPLDKHDVDYVTLQIILRSMSPNQLLTPYINAYSLKFKKYGAL